MIEVKNTKEMRQLRRAVSSLALEDMYVDDDFLNEMIKVSNGEKSSEELRQEVIKKYAR